MTVFNAGISCPLTVHLSSGLWLADSLGVLVSQFGSRASSHVWEAVEGGDADSSLTGSSLGLLNGNNNVYQYQEHAQYWALQMLAQDWAIAGDATAHQLVSATSNQALLSVFADLRPDGVLSLLVVNKDPSNAYNSTLNLAGFLPNATANRWTYDASNYTWNTSALPYHAAPGLPPTQGTEAAVSTSFSHSFAPYSITVFQFTDSTQATLTPTLTPTPPSPTVTPTYGPHLLTVSPTQSPSFSASPTFTNSPSETQSSTQSPTFSISPTLTVSPTTTETISPSPSLTVSPSQSSSPTLTASPIATVTVTSVPVPNGPAQIVLVQAQPNPFVDQGSAGLALLLTGHAERLRVRVYSTAFVRLADLTLPGGGPGWIRASLPEEAIPENSGLFFAEVWAENGGKASPVKRLNLYRLR